ncbi:MAG: hypothetical protein ACLP7O_04445 [Terracidiphilus sp.]
MYEINSLHLCHVDESVTENPRFCPFFSLFGGKNRTKSAVSDGFLQEENQLAGILETPRPSKSADPDESCPASGLPVIRALQTLQQFFT